MSAGRLLWGFLGISCLIHAGAFLTMTGFPWISPKPEADRTVEVTYLPLPPPARKVSQELVRKEAVTKLREEKKLLPQLPLPPHKERFEIPKELERDFDYQIYYQLVRDRIRSYAEQNYKGFQSSGIVHLAFILNAGGTLNDIEVFKQDTSANDLLRQVAVRSIKDSAPFPVFPATLEHKELPFSIYIEFKGEREQAY